MAHSSSWLFACVVASVGVVLYIPEDGTRREDVDPAIFEAGFIVTSGTLNCEGRRES